MRKKIFINMSKSIPLKAMKATWGMWMQGFRYTMPRYHEEIEWLVLCLAVFTPQGKPLVLIL